MITNRVQYMMIKRFKQHLLNEGWGAVKRDYVEKDKLSPVDLTYMQGLLKKHGDHVGKMGEWLAKWWVTNRKKFNVEHFMEMKKTDYVLLDLFLEKYYEYRRSKAITTMPPTNKLLKDLLIWNEEESKKYYSKKKMKLPSSLKKGEDYEEVYNKDGIQVFKILTFKASDIIGAGANWCVKREEGTWNDYNFSQGLRFYYIRNHRYSSDHDLYKIAVVVNKSNHIDSIWDRTDSPSNLRAKDIVGLIGGSKVFKYFEVERKYSKEQIKELDKEFKGWISRLQDDNEEFNKEFTKWAEDHDVWKEFKIEYAEKEAEYKELKDELYQLEVNLQFKTEAENIQLNMYNKEQSLKLIKELKPKVEKLAQWLDRYEQYKDDPSYYISNEVNDYSFEEYYMEGYHSELYPRAGSELTDFYEDIFGEYSEEKNNLYYAAEQIIMWGDISNISDFEPSVIYDNN